MEDQERSIYEQVRDEQRYYDDRQDSDDDWEVVPAPDALPAKSLRRTMISTRFSPEEAEEIRLAATREG
ncbi:MAG: hypothetical protein QOE37_2300, partial [Microbacteriaceae bacterium]|nr:hypothetical protein [Microbacteriaceae bacterium]